ncbi:unnamed protein product [Citrullus colocynthis]|uniref:Uncharacterized protein n=1 Tax=Citrullus colocynthis TaxID=252529 RepID=A0ABP0YMH5_9ROSI
MDRVDITCFHLILWHIWCLHDGGVVSLPAVIESTQELGILLPLDLGLCSCKKFLWGLVRRRPVKMVLIGRFIVILSEYGVEAIVLYV